MKRSFVRTTWLAIGISLAAAGCGGGEVDDPTGPGGGGTTPVATTSVSVRDDFFTPAAIAVSPGATVTWTFSGAVPHNVTFPSTAIADSPNQTSGTFTAVMPTALGTYNYSCTIHAGMNGTVQVR